MLRLAHKNKYAIERKNLPLLTDEMCKLVNVGDSKQLGHQVVAEMSRSHFHCLTRFPQLVYSLNTCQNCIAIYVK